MPGVTLPIEVKVINFIFNVGEEYEYLQFDREVDREYFYSKSVYDADQHAIFFDFSLVTDDQFISIATLFDYVYQVHDKSVISTYMNDYMNNLITLYLHSTFR